MPAAIIGKKIGMTRLYVTRKEGEEGSEIEVVTQEPVTVIEAGPCFVSQIKSTDRDGYDAIQIAYEDVKARNSTMPLIGHDGKAGISPKRFHREVRVSAEEAANYQLGQAVTVEALSGVLFVDVIGTSKGKGFAGTMKRWNFKGQCASHGTERKHRSPGSIASHATNRGFSGRPKKGKKMPGHLGSEQITVRSLEVIGCDKDKNLLWVKGPVPGPNQGMLMIREATRLYKRKASKVAKAS